MSAVEWIIVVFGAITGYGLVGAVLTRRKPPAVPASPHWTQVLGLPLDAGVPDIEAAASQLAAEVFDVRLVNEIILKAMCLRDDPLREKSLRRETPLSLAA